MKIQLPENTSEVTLRQFQEYYKIIENEELKDVDKLKKTIRLFTNLKSTQIEKIQLNQLNEINEQIVTALNKEKEFIQVFEFDGVEFGFIPNLDKITFAEWVDLNTYRSDTENLNKIMAILFRPITKKDKFDNYSIEDYKGTEQWSEKFKHLPLNLVNGSLGFFLTLSEELQKHIQKYTTQKE